MRRPFWGASVGAVVVAALLRLAPIDPESAEPDRAVKSQSE